MEEMETAKEWFVTHDGKQFGPVSLDDLRFEAERGELNPRLDMVWKNGMDDWIPAGEVEGLFQRNDEAKAAEEAKEAAFTGYKPEISEEEKKLIKGEWTGVGRGTFFFVCYILPFLWIAGVGFGMKYLEGKVEPGLLAIGALALCLVPLILAIAATLQRFQNLGMSRVWFLGLFVPLLNLWVWYRLFACPPGYAYHKKLDPLGWVLAVFHWGTVLLLVAAFGFAAYTLSEAAEDDPTRIAIEGYIETFEEARKDREAP
jgi:hypothetical protein